jgi:hypothetical protein
VVRSVVVVVDVLGELDEDGVLDDVSLDGDAVLDDVLFAGWLVSAVAGAAWVLVSGVDCA